MSRNRWTRVLAGAGVVVLMGGVALAQFGRPRERVFIPKNISYDGRFTFVRTMPPRQLGVNYIVYGLTH